MIISSDDHTVTEEGTLDELLDVEEPSLEGLDATLALLKHEARTFTSEGHRGKPPKPRKDVLYKAVMREFAHHLTYRLALKIKLEAAVDLADWIRILNNEFGTIFTRDSAYLFALIVFNGSSSARFKGIVNRLFGTQPQDLERMKQNTVIFRQKCGKGNAQDVWSFSGQSGLPAIRPRTKWCIFCLSADGEMWQDPLSS